MGIETWRHVANRFGVIIIVGVVSSGFNMSSAAAASSCDELIQRLTATKLVDALVSALPNPSDEVTRAANLGKQYLQGRKAVLILNYVDGISRHGGKAERHYRTEILFSKGLTKDEAHDVDLFSVHKYFDKPSFQWIIIPPDLSSEPLVRLTCVVETE